MCFISPKISTIAVHNTVSNTLAYIFYTGTVLTWEMLCFHRKQENSLTKELSNPAWPKEFNTGKPPEVRKKIRLNVSRYFKGIFKSIQMSEKLWISSGLIPSFNFTYGVMYQKIFILNGLKYSNINFDWFLKELWILAAWLTWQFDRKRILPKRWNTLTGRATWLSNLSNTRSTEKRTLGRSSSDCFISAVYIITTWFLMLH